MALPALHTAEGFSHGVNPVPSLASLKLRAADACSFFSPSLNRHCFAEGFLTHLSNQGPCNAS